MPVVPFDGNCGFEVAEDGVLVNGRVVAPGTGAADCTNGRSCRYFVNSG
jgi:hypothetical protein